MRWEAELKVGILVVTAAILLAILLMMAADWNVGRPGKDLSIRFSRVENLKRGAAVHVAGVAIGKVVGFRYDDALGKVVVVARIETPVTLRRGLQARIGTLGLVGEAYIALTNGPRTEPELDWTTPIEGAAPADLAELILTATASVRAAGVLLESMDTMLEETRTELLATADAVRGAADGSAEDVRRLAARAEPLFGRIERFLDAADTRVAAVLERAESSIGHADEGVDATVADVRALNQDARSWLDETRGRTSALLDRADGTLDETRRMVVQLSDEAQRLRAHLSAAADTTSSAVRQEQEHVAAAVARLDETIRRAGDLIGRLNAVAERVQSGHGTLGALVSRDALVPKMERALDAAGSAFESLDAFAKPAERLLAQQERPLAQVGAELTYRTAFRGVQHELAVRLSPTSRYDLLGGVVSREGQQLWKAVVARRVGAWAVRVGFLESKSALGVEWSPAEWATVRADALGISRRLVEGEWPGRLDATLFLRPVPWAYAVFGAENLTGDVGLILGVRSGY